MINEDLKDTADQAIFETYERYWSDCIDWMTKHCTKEDVQKLYSVTKAKIDKVYKHFKGYYGVSYTEKEAKEAIRAVMVELAETRVAPKISSGYTKHSLFRGVTDEEHAKYSLKNILTGSDI